jgi:putative flippase GtrA
MAQIGDRAGETGRVMRFFASGAFNTAITYTLYLFALRFWSPQVAYTLVYLVGIALAYALNRSFVFRSHAGWRSALAMPLIYLVQYGVSLAIVSLWVWVGLPAFLAPLPAIVLCLPLVYFMSRFSFMRTKPQAPCARKS